MIPSIIIVYSLNAKLVLVMIRRFKETVPCSSKSKLSVQPL